MQRDPSALVLVSRSRSRFSYITNQDHRSQKQLAPVSFSSRSRFLLITLWFQVKLKELAQRDPDG